MMYVIKNILHKSVNNVLYCSCAYSLCSKYEYYKGLKEIYESDNITEMDILNIKKSDFAMKYDYETKQNTISIQCLNNKCSHSVRTKKHELLYLHDNCSLYKLPNKRRQIQSQMIESAGDEGVQCKLLGYIDYKENDFEFIKIVDINEFDQKIKSFDKQENILLGADMFVFDKTEQTCTIKPECSKLQYGKIEVINNNCVLYRPEGSNVAVSIGRFDFIVPAYEEKTSLFFTEETVFFTEETVSHKNLPVIVEEGQIKTTNKYVMKSAEYVALASGVYIDFKILTFYFCLASIYKRLSLTNMDILNIKKSDFFLRGDCDKESINGIYIKCSGHFSIDFLALTKKHEPILLDNDGSLYDLSDFNHTQDPDFVQIKLLGYVDDIRDNSFGEFIKVVDYNEFASQVQSKHIISIKIYPDIFGFNKKNGKVIIKDPYKQLQHGKICIAGSKYIFYQPEQLNIAILIGTLYYSNNNGEKILTFQKKENLPSYFQITDYFKEEQYFQQKLQLLNYSEQLPVVTKFKVPNSLKKQHQPNCYNKTNVSQQNQSGFSGSKHNTDYKPYANSKTSSDKFDSDIFYMVFMLFLIPIVCFLVVILSPRKDKKQKSEQQGSINNTEYLKKKHKKKHNKIFKLI